MGYGREQIQGFLEAGSFSEALNRNFVYDAAADQGLPDPQSWEVLEDFIKRKWTPERTPHP